MTALVTEQRIIDRLATDFESIDGITRAYPYAQNPDTLSPSQLPCVLFLPTEFRSEHRANFNWRKNEFDITCAVFVATRQTAGGRLKYIENRAIPLLGKIRTKFQNADTTRGLLNLGLVSGTTFTGTYGAGGLLTHNGIEYIGCIINWTFIEIS